MINTLAVSIACTVNGTKLLRNFENEKDALKFILQLHDTEFNFANVTYQFKDTLEVIQTKFDIFEDLIYELS